MSRHILFVFPNRRSAIHILAALLLLVMFVGLPTTFIPAASAADAIIYVDITVENPEGDNDGSSWQKAYTDLYLALTAAGNGTEIWVAVGNYMPASAEDGRRTLSFELKSGVKIYGGFSGTETQRDQRNPDPATNKTILSGDVNGDDQTGNYDDNSYHVVTCQDVNSAAVLDGFTIRGGNANTNDNNRGGGMYNLRCSATLSNLLFVDNNANNEGGGMYNESSSPQLTNVQFIGNTAPQGGGMLNKFESTPNLKSVAFIGNFASGNGGGVSNAASNPRFSSTLFVGNRAGMNGGGMSNSFDSQPILTGVTFAGNMAKTRGGAIYSYSSGSDTSMSTLRNTLLWGNRTNSMDLVEQQIVDPNAHLVTALVQGRPADADPRFGRLPSPGADGLFADDPDTLADESADDDYGDLRLLPGSPAIDTGSNAVVDTPYDVRGTQRVINERVDIGAYESHGFSLTALSGTAQSAMIGSAFATPLTVKVESPANEPVAGGTITFAGPNAGAGIDPTATMVTISNNDQASLNAVANQSGGSYTVQAGGNGIAAPVSFDLQNEMPILTATGGNGSESLGVVSFTVSLDVPCPLPVKATYTTADETAIAGSDYRATSGLLEIAPGAMSGIINIQVFSDEQTETVETFRLVLSSPVHTVLATDEVTGTIQADQDVIPQHTIYLPLLRRSS